MVVANGEATTWDESWASTWPRIIAIGACLVSSNLEAQCILEKEAVRSGESEMT